MRVRRSMEYRGSDPFNARRKVMQVLRVAAIEGRIAPGFPHSHDIQFFSELQAVSWAAAIAEVLDVAARFSAGWQLSLGRGVVCGMTQERKVERVETLRFELPRDQVFAAPVA